MSEFNNANPSWSDYLGDALRGNVPVNQLIPQHSYILDTLGLGEVFEKYTQHLMLMTLEEAQGIVDDLCNSKPVSYATTYAGNINDVSTGGKNISKLMSYTDAGKIIYRLKGLGIKAIQYSYNGKVYVKITGYASLRRILQGTRYKINHPQILELGIGKAGINGNIISGAKFCVWFSLAWHTVELIFKSDHDVAAFIGNITMDVAKIIVTIFVTKILAVGGSFLAVGAASFGIVVPIALGIVLIVAMGFSITRALDYMDKKYQLSEKLIATIKEGMKAQQDIHKWNFKHTDPFMLGLMSTHG
ncbi:hypothetical protein FNI15_21730 [Salmonella enterica subsp. salamae]|nr:hypothetical protein [Salmonella enterica subsp. salamae]EDN4182397.1 hypothetical protein [Salmonella enterica subsp. salamae]